MMAKTGYTIKLQVSLCAGCHLYEPWAALVVGVLGGLGFLAVHFLMYVK